MKTSWYCALSRRNSSTNSLMASKLKAAECFWEAPNVLVPWSKKENKENPIPFEVIYVDDWVVRVCPPAKLEMQPQVALVWLFPTWNRYIGNDSSPGNATRGVSLVWQVLASAALKFQPVWDLLGEAVAVHMQFRAGLYPKGAGLHRNTTGRWTLTQGLGFTRASGVGAAGWFYKEIHKMGNAHRVPGRTCEVQATGLDENHYCWFIWKKRVFSLPWYGFGKQEVQVFLSALSGSCNIRDKLLRLYFKCQGSILQV